DGDRGDPDQHPPAPGAHERRGIHPRRREHPFPRGEDGGAEVDPGRVLTGTRVAWQRLALVVPGAHAEALGDALEAHGAIAIEITDADAGTAAEEARFGEPGAEVAPWPRALVAALFDDGAAVDAALARALADAGAPALSAASVDRVDDADWVALTQRQF